MTRRKERMDEMKKFIVREVKETDAVSLALIIRELGWFTHLDRESFPETVDGMKSQIDISKSDERSFHFVAESKDDNIVGYVGVHFFPCFFLPSFEGYISELFVKEDNRGQGIGRLLMNRVVALAKEKKCHRLTLVNSRTRESYRRGFYEKMGWQEREKVASFVFKL